MTNKNEHVDGGLSFVCVFVCNSPRTGSTDSRPADHPIRDFWWGSPAYFHDPWKLGLSGTPLVDSLLLNSWTFWINLWFSMKNAHFVPIVLPILWKQATFVFIVAHWQNWFIFLIISQNSGPFGPLFQMTILDRYFMWPTWSEHWNTTKSPTSQMTDRALVNLRGVSPPF